MLQDNLAAVNVKVATLGLLRPEHRVQHNLQACREEVGGWQCLPAPEKNIGKCIFKKHEFERNSF